MLFRSDLKPESEWTRPIDKAGLLREMDGEISKLPGVEPSFSQPIRDNVLESISQIKGQIVVKVAGDDLQALRQTVEAMQREFKQVPGIQRAEVDRLGELPQLVIDIDRERAARFGLNVSDVQDVIEAALAGKAATQIWEGERKFAAAVRLPQERRSIEQLARTPIAIPDGG